MWNLIFLVTKIFCSTLFFRLLTNMLPNFVTSNEHWLFFLFSYLDFRFYFACCPPESFKIICFTCIWSKFVDTSLYSSQNPQQNPCRISPFSKNRGVKLITHRGLGLAKSILCAKFGGIRRSNAKFCEFFSVNPWFWAKIRNFSQVCFSLKKA